MDTPMIGIGQFDSSQNRPWKKRRRIYNFYSSGWRRKVKRIILAALIMSFAVQSAMAQATCESKAISKDGKPLAGAVKTSFVNKCKKDACEGNAVSKDGKPLSGAAKNSFMTKCEKDA